MHYLAELALSLVCHSHFLFVWLQHFLTGPVCSQFSPATEYNQLLSNLQKSVSFPALPPNLPHFFSSPSSLIPLFCSSVELRFRRVDSYPSGRPKVVTAYFLCRSLQDTVSTDLVVLPGACLLKCCCVHPSLQLHAFSL